MGVQVLVATHDYAMLKELELLMRLSLQPLLLEHLAERLRRRVKREGPDPWKREYVSACTIVPALDLGRALPGCSARRVSG